MGSALHPWAAEQDRLPGMRKKESPMSLRQRLLAVFRGETPDRVPFFADLSYWYESQRLLGTLPGRYEGEEGYLRLHQDCGVGIYLYAPAPFEVIVDASVRYEGYADDRERVGEMITPVGTLRQRHRFCPESCSWAPAEYPVKRVEDLRVVRYVAEASRTESRYERFAECDRQWGESGLPVCLTTRSPLGRLVVEWAGLETLAFLIADYPREVERTLEVLRISEDTLYSLLGQSPAELVEIPDNLSGEAVGGWFRRYSFDYYRYRVAGLHGAGKKVGVHLDGTLHGLIGTLSETGLDFIESVTPAPVGDLPIEALRPLVRPHMVLWGGIPGAMFSRSFPRDRVHRHLRHVLETEGRTGRFVLASADQVPPDGDIGLVREIAEWVENFPIAG